MRTKLFITLFIISFSTICSAQQKFNWEQWQWLIGNWKGVGSGQPGQGEGQFSFSYDMDKHILVRKNHTEFPAANGSSATVHDDLMIVYPENPISLIRAIYFDNEGHVINYSVTSTENSIVFTGDKVANMPIFRLTYTLLDKNLVNTKFEMSQDGTNFRTYIEGKSQKTD